MKTFAADSKCQVYHGNGICSIVMALEGEYTETVGSSEANDAEEDEAYDLSLMDWTQQEEDLHDAEVELPGGAT